MVYLPNTSVGREPWAAILTFFCTIFYITSPFITYARGPRAPRPLVVMKYCGETNGCPTPDKIRKGALAGTGRGRPGDLERANGRLYVGSARV